VNVERLTVEFAEETVKVSVEVQPGGRFTVNRVLKSMIKGETSPIR
jgi:hypothetical protein